MYLTHYINDLWKVVISSSGYNEEIQPEWYIIHLFPLHKGDMQICSPEKSHISRGQRHARGKYDYFEGEQIFISLLCKGNECFIPPAQRFWWILSNEIFWPSLSTKLLFRNISGVIFTNMEYRYMTKALNIENFE